MYIIYIRYVIYIYISIHPRYLNRQARDSCMGHKPTHIMCGRPTLYIAMNILFSCPIFKSYNILLKTTDNPVYPVYPSINDIALMM